MGKRSRHRHAATNHAANDHAANDKTNTAIKLDAERPFVKHMAVQADKDGIIRIGLRRTYLLPSQRGLYYLLTSMVMFVWSINYALSLGYAMTFLVIVLALLVAVLAVGNIANTRVKALYNPTFFAGEPAYFRLQIDNDKPTPAITVSGRRNGLLSKPITILAGGHAVLEVPAHDNTRGRKNLGYLRLSGDYPMGIFRVWCWGYFDADLLIYPQPSGNLSLPFLAEHHGIDEGRVDLHGAEDFSDLRDYQAGDNLRHVDWRKVSQGQVRVKCFQDLAGQECILDFADKRMTQLATEERLSQLCRWVLDAEKLGTKYALRLPNRRIDFGLGTGHKSKCLEALACY